MYEISYAKYLASPRYMKFPFSGIIGWILSADRLPTVEDLQKQYAFTYYSTMNKAVTDVNNDSIGANEDAVKDTAVAGVYTDENGDKNVVLLKDHAESSRISPSVDMTINLGGHVLSFTDKVGVDIVSGDIFVDGRLSGSTIQVTREDAGANAKAIQLKSSYTGHLTVKGGTYIGNSASANNSSVIAVLGGTLDISNANVIATDSDGATVGISVNYECLMNVSNCYINSISSGDGECRGVAVYGSATLSNCIIKAYSNYTYGVESYYDSISSGVSIDAKSTAIINNCHVIGTHSGLQNFGTLRVNGGTFEGYGHGGFYFSNSDAVSYVRNATIRDCEMPDGYTATANRNGAGFYFGDCANSQVYMDNCEINGIATSQIFVIKGTNNTLYISNSTINNTTGGDANIRIDDGGNMLYTGIGNNFNATDTNRPGNVVLTDEVYVYGWDTDMLISSDGYGLYDINGQILIPKESE